jgi:hypothetical protein
MLELDSAAVPEFPLSGTAAFKFSLRRPPKRNEASDFACKAANPPCAAQSGVLNRCPPWLFDRSIAPGELGGR